MAFSYSPKIVTDGLVLYLDAANPYSYVSGSLNWNDLSRSQLSGSLVNGPTYSSANNGSIVFDGTNDYVNCGSNAGSVSGSQFTISSFFYWDGTATSRNVFGKRNGYPYNQYSVGIRNGPNDGGNGNNICSFVNPDGNTIVVVHFFLNYNTHYHQRDGMKFV
jgi:hypothetical protein